MPATRDLTPLTEPTEWDELSPDELDEVLRILDGRPEDPLAYELRAQDLEPQDQPTERDTTWTWDLDDPYAWDAYAGDPALTAGCRPDRSPGRSRCRP